MIIRSAFACTGPARALALLALLALPPWLHAQFDPARAYQQSPQVRERYPDPTVAFDTPGFRAGRSDFTSHEEMLAYVNDLQRRSPAVRIRDAGVTHEGRAIPALVLSREGIETGEAARELRRPVVVLTGLQHGNEPAGGEAMLVLARELALGQLRPLLDRLTVVIIPHANPDGAWYFRRSPFRNTDINRDHVKLDLPETRAIHRVVNEFEPHVFVDAHEFSVATRWIEKFGAIQSYDLTVQYATHPLVHRSLTALADGPFMNAFRAAAGQAGYSHFWYYTTSYNLKNLLVSMGGTSPDIGRNFAGLQHAVSFLVESRGVGIGRDSYARRVHSHVVATGALLRAAADQARELMAAVEEARADTVRRGQAAAPGDSIAARVRSPVVKQKLAMLDPASGEPREIEVDWSDSLKAEADITRQRPWAYVLLPPFGELAERLRLSGVRVQQLAAPVTLEVESYEVTERRASTSFVEGRITHQVSTSVSAKTVRLPAGSFVIPMAQANANVAVVAMEPESPSSFVAFGMIPTDRKDAPATIGAGSEIPLYRILRPASLPLRDMAAAH